jgi:NRPS condensation-like uncharacterized protein
VVDQLDPNNPLYNIPRRVRLQGRLDIDAFRRALNEMVRRHESQRTTFAVCDGQPVQTVHDNANLDLQIHDLTALPESEREAAAREIAHEDALTPFHLERGPLLRVQLIRMAPQDHVFLLTAHHIVSDRWSAGVFLKELGLIYEAFSQGKPSPLPEPAIQYGDYCRSTIFTCISLSSF